MAEKKSKLAVIKTKPTSRNVENFINTVENEQKRKDSFVLLDMMRKATGEEPVLWSNSIIGFGIKRYKSPATGREVDWLRIGFSPRKANLTVYFVGLRKNGLTVLLYVSAIFSCPSRIPFKFAFLHL